MPAAIAIPLITAAATGATTLIGAKLNSNAVNDGSKLQAAGTKDALDFTKQQYGDLQGRLKPYNDAGTTAVGRMSALLGQSPYLSARPQPQAAAAPAAGGMVTLRGPDGSMKQFQQGDPTIARALAAGAQRVG